VRHTFLGLDLFVQWLAQRAQLLHSGALGHAVSQLHHGAPRFLGELLVAEVAKRYRLSSVLSACARATCECAARRGRRTQTTTIHAFSCSLHP